MTRHPCGCPLDEPHDLDHPDCERAAREAVEACTPLRTTRVYEYDPITGLEAKTKELPC
jgi:hypothetical protein